MTDAFLSPAIMLVDRRAQLATASSSNGADALASPNLAAIIRERLDQIERHGFDHHHDDLHDGCELARGAVAYVTAGMIDELEDDATYALDQALAVWPWGDLFKPGDYRDCLIKAAAMLWAEADRVTRAQALIDAVSQLSDDGRKCRRCDCTSHNACLTEHGACFWIGEDLCSACAGKPDPQPA
jgi:hypothetical protein